VEIFISVHLIVGKADPPVAPDGAGRGVRPTLLRYFLRYSRFLLLLQERHHFTQLAAHLFDLRIAGFLAHLEELMTPGLVLFDPLAREVARLNLREDLLHFGAGLLIDHSRTARVIAVLRGIGYRVAHVAEAAFLNQ